MLQFSKGYFHTLKILLYLLINIELIFDYHRIYLKLQHCNTATLQQRVQNEACSSYAECQQPRQRQQVQQRCKTVEVNVLFVRNKIRPKTLLVRNALITWWEVPHLIMIVLTEFAHRVPVVVNVVGDTNPAVPLVVFNPACSAKRRALYFRLGACFNTEIISSVVAS